MDWNRQKLFEIFYDEGELLQSLVTGDDCRSENEEQGAIQRSN